MTPEGPHEVAAEVTAGIAVDPAALIDDVVARLAPLAHLHGTDLAAVWCGNLPDRVQGDVAHVRRTVTWALECRVRAPGTAQITVGWVHPGELEVALRVEVLGEAEDTLGLTKPGELRLRFPLRVDLPARPRPARRALVADSSLLVHAAVASLTTGRVFATTDRAGLRLALASGGFSVAFVDVELLDPPTFSALAAVRASGLRVVATARLAGGQSPRIDEFDLDGLLEKPLRREAVRPFLSARPKVGSRVDGAPVDAPLPPPVAATATPTLADLAALEDGLGCLAHDVGALAAAELLDGWLADTTIRIAAMPYLAGLPALPGRRSRLHRAAHTLKGNCLLFGLGRLNTLSAALAARTLDASLPGDEPSLAELWAHFAGIRPALQALSARLRASVL